MSGRRQSRMATHSTGKKLKCARSFLQIVGKLLENINTDDVLISKDEDIALQKAAEIDTISLHCG